MEVSKTEAWVGFGSELLWMLQIMPVPVNWLVSLAKKLVNCEKRGSLKKECLSLWDVGFRFLTAVFAH